MADLVPIHFLRAGESCRVAQILGCAEHVQRVKEMGICDGCAIEIVRSGSPCIVRLGSQTLCLRTSELLSVLVRPGVAA